MFKKGGYFHNLPTLRSVLRITVKCNNLQLKHTRHTWNICCGCTKSSKQEFYDRNITLCNFRQKLKKIIITLIQKNTWKAIVCESKMFFSVSFLFKTNSLLLHCNKTFQALIHQVPTLCFVYARLLPQNNRNFSKFSR